MLKYLLNENEQEMGVIVDEKKGTEERDVKERLAGTRDCQGEGVYFQLLW